MFRQLLIFFLVLMSGVSVVRADAHEVAATIFGSIAPQSTVPGKQWQLRLRVPERDGVAGEVSASHLPAGAQLLTESSQWVVLDWTPAATQSGKYSMTVSARFEGKDPISFFQVVDVNVVGDSRPIRMRPSIVVPKRIDQIDAMAEEATRNATDAKAETESAAIGVAEPGSSMVSPETDSSVEETAEAKPSTDEIQSEDVQIEKAQTEEALDEQLQQGRARVQELENKKLEKQALRQRLRAERLKKQQSRLLEEDQQRARNRQARAKFIQERRAKESILKAQQTEEQEQLPVAQEQALELPTAQEQVAEEQLAKDPVVQEQTQIERAAPATQEEQALSAQGQEKQHSETPLPGQAASKEVASGEQASDEQTSVLPAEQGSESLDTDDPMLDERGDEGENSDEQATLDLESNADAESVRQSIALLRSAGGNTALDCLGMPVLREIRMVQEPFSGRPITWIRASTDFALQRIIQTIQPC